jgi:hypothetical protein
MLLLIDRSFTRHIGWTLSHATPNFILHFALQV